MKRIAIAGLGAVGGFIAARLLGSGVEVSALVTDRQVEPLNRHGLRLREHGGLQGWSIRASSNAAELGEQDIVFIAVKATSLSGLIGSIAPLMGPATWIVPAMNGVPWWFGPTIDHAALARPLSSVDRDARIAQALPPERVIGCVVHLTSALLEPGLVEHGFGQGLLLGPARADRESTKASVDIAALLGRAGFDAQAVPSIHREVWSKLWGNMTMNPASLLTLQTTDQILQDSDLREFLSRAMLEAGAVGERIGIPMPMTPEERHAIAGQLGAFRTSMLQDFEAGRAVELDALVGAVIEIAERVDVPVPSVRALMGMARLRARAAGLY